MADDNDQLLASLGVTAKSSDQVEKEVIGKALHKTTDAAGDAQTDGGSAAKVQAALDTVSLEIEALKAALQTNDDQQQEQLEGEDEDEAGSPKPAVEDRALRTATMHQRLEELQEQQQQLQEQLQKAEAEEADGVAVGPAIEDDNLFDQLATGSSRMVETSRDRRVRLGLLTPFDNLQGFERNVKSSRPRSSAPPVVTNPTDEGLDPDTSQLLNRVSEKAVELVTNRHTAVLLNPVQLPTPERAVRQLNTTFWRDAASSKTVPNTVKRRRASTLPRQRKSAKGKAASKDSAGRADGKKAARNRKRRKSDGSDEGDGNESSDYIPSELEDTDQNSNEEYEEDSGLDSDDEVEDLEDDEVKDPAGDFDDADENFYNRRSKRLLSMPEAPPEGENELEEEVVFDGGFKVPGGIYHRLFDYQKTGVKWLWELYCQRAGGIMGDEMGLGKTIQVIAFLAGLHYSGMFRPSLVVCPATVLRQWLRELRTWYPPFRVLLFHDSARSPDGSRPSREELVDITYRSETAVVVTTYDQLRIHRDVLLGVHWGVAVLDEGHKIRNPDSEITLVCKQILTVHRVIMSGSPIQNRLSELWSLFDFIFPGKLGTLPVFQAQFAIPIQIGGYANANKLQVSTAFKCAVILRDLITPYLLRRRKADVNANLPKKTEQVLFCTLTQEQRELYRAYLNSTDVSEILEGRRRALQGIDVLRKICNHPDILERSKADVINDYGHPNRSGKLVVTEKLLSHWKEGGSKALVFSQTQQMLEILERLVLKHGWRYHRMDGSTAIAQRARLVDDFNNNPDVFCFLLTTKVGGLGVNLTGADKVLLYDPDWNPATDSQARERAWRIGQTRHVTVYRLITGGTIEEKVYHRQIYKNFLTNKVLRDPRQKRFFTARDISDLFTLADEHAKNETANIFGGVEEEVPLAPVGARSRGKDKQKGKFAKGGAKDGKRGRGSKSTRGVNVVQEGEGEEEGEEQQGRDETKLLRDLFEGTGIRSLMNHDKIEGANDPEVVALDQEAARMARKAAEALRNSRQACMTASINIPTWTGRHGAAGAPPPAPTPAKKRFGTVINSRLMQSNAASTSAGPSPVAAIPGLAGRPGGLTKPGSKAVRPGSGSAAAAGQSHFSGALAGTSGGGAPSSAQLLEAMRARQQNLMGAGAELSAGSASPGSSSPAATRPSGSAAGPSSPAGENSDDASLLLTRIISFLHANNGMAATDVVIKAFQTDVPQSKVPLFKHLLRQAARLQKVNGVGFWKLKSEFQQEKQETTAADS